MVRVKLGYLMADKYQKVKYDKKENARIGFGSPGRRLEGSGLLAVGHL
jgi:hypothetical protein